MSRRQRSSKAPAVRPTYVRILEHAVKVLNEDGFDRFSVQRVLDSAQVSRATMYRHFPDVDGLIEAALVEQFRHEVDRTLELVIDVIEQSTDLASFRRAIHALLQSFSTMPASVRLRRTHIIALATTRPHLAVAIAAVQDVLTEGWATALRRAQDLGMVRADVDNRTMGVMIQAMAIGRIVDDAASDHVADERWAQTFFDILDRAVIVTAPDEATTSPQNSPRRRTRQAGRLTP